MPRIFTNARNAKTVPQVQSVRYATGQTFKAGAILVEDANGEAVEGGADPTGITGVALQAAGTGLGYDLPNSSTTTVVTGRLQEVSVAIADRDTQFSGRAVNGGTDPVTPLQTHIGEQYGLLKTGAGEWVIDIAEVAAPRVEITDIVPGEGGQPGFFLFKFLEANLARP